MPCLKREELLPAARAWVHARGCGGPVAESLPRAVGWLRRQWEQGKDHLPLDLVYDLGHLLLLGRSFPFSSERDLGRWPEDQRQWRLAYEDRILGRWLLDPSVTEAHVSIAGLPRTLRHEAIAHAVGLALARRVPRLPETVFGNPAHLRSLAPELGALAENWPGEFEQRQEVVTTGWLEWARDRREALLPGLGAGRLLSAEDLWEVRHFEELPVESTRLSLREINRASAAAGPVSAATALMVQRRVEEMPVEGSTEDTFPAGGFAAIGTRGRFENLVRTEVAYVGEGMGAHGDGVDLFDVRWAQGELLYYMRDDSPLLDQQRELTLVLDRPAELRYKHRELEAQTLVLAQGLAVQLQEDLAQIFGPRNQAIHLCWRVTGAEDRQAAVEEQQLMSLIWAAEMDHRRATLRVMDDWDDPPDRWTAVISPRPPREGVEAAAWIDAGQPAWRLGEQAFDLAQPGATRVFADALLMHLYG